MRNFLSRIAAKPDRVIAAIALLILAALWAVVLERTQYERARTVANIERTNTNLAIAFDAHITRTLKGLDQILVVLGKEYELKGRQFQLHETVRESFDPQVFTTFAITDAKGVVLLSNRESVVGADLGDRDYFKALSAGGVAGLTVGRTVDGRLSGRPTIPLARPVIRDGVFRGMVLLGISPAYFTDIYGQMALGQDGAIFVVGVDGQERIRRTDTRSSHGQDMSGSELLRHARMSPSGNFVARGRADGIPRFVAYRVQPEFGLILAVGQPVESALADFQARRNANFVAAAATSLLLVFLALALTLALRRSRRAQEASYTAHQRLRATYDQAAFGILITSLDLRFIDVNDAFAAMLGYRRDGLIGRFVKEVTIPDDMPGSERLRAELLGERQAPGLVLEKRYRHANGGTVWTLIAPALVKAEDGTPEVFVTIVQDVTARKQLEAKARESEARYRATFDQSAVGIAHGALDGKLFDANPAFCALVGYSREELLEKNFSDFTHPQDVGLSLAAAAELLKGASASPIDYEKRYLHKNGTEVWARVSISLVRDAEGHPRYFIALVQDMTARKNAEAMVRYQSQYDRLTGLPNRVLCFDRLEQALVQAKRNKWTTGILLMDLDNFFSVNDAFGSAVGDEVLQFVATRIAGCVRAGDTAARVSGDGFAVVLSDLKKPQDASIVAQKIIRSLATPVQTSKGEVFVTASIGISTCPPDTEDAGSLLAHAGNALLSEKALGKNGFQFYTEQMNARAQEKLVLQASLRQALERGEFLLHYQPKARLANGRVDGFEALLRWRRADGQLVSPAQFVPVLEESGLIVEVGAWAIEAACRQCAGWIAQGLDAVPVAVNLSAKQFLRGGIEEIVRKALAASGLPPSFLELEITETAAMQDPAHAAQVLAALRAQGIRISIDDFGTGYSSLGYLKKFPVHSLKLDRSFVTGLPENAENVAIARAVIAMAHSLGLTVVAEGVEEIRQRDFLAATGCDLMQGYLLSKPLPADACVALLGVAEAAAA